jgi:predicted RNase H-like HicB family nuclease
MREYEVRAFWDPEASVWVAESEDVPGLVTEAETVEQLIAKLQVMVPELLDANEVAKDKDVSIKLVAQRAVRARRDAALNGRLRAGA